MKKRFFITVTAAVLALYVIGCGSKEQTTPEPTSTPTPEPTATPMPTEAPVEGPKVSGEIYRISELEFVYTLTEEPWENGSDGFWAGGEYYYTDGTTRFDLVAEYGEIGHGDSCTGTCTLDTGCWGDYLTYEPIPEGPESGWSNYDRVFVDKATGKKYAECSLTYLIEITENFTEDYEACEAYIRENYMGSFTYDYYEGAYTYDYDENDELIWKKVDYEITYCYYLYCGWKGFSIYQNEDGIRYICEYPPRLKLPQLYAEEDE